MGRLKAFKIQKPAAKQATDRQQRLSNAERSAYFARREAAKILRTILHGDAYRRAVGSIKTLVYSPSVKNKKATFALVCETLKHLSVIKDILEGASGVMNSKWKRQAELIYIVAYDILFGKETPSYGDAEKFLVRRKDDLESALARLLVKKKVKRVEELLAPDISKPRYVRVNTLKIDVESAMSEFQKQYPVQKDDLVPDLLTFPPGTDLHDHPLVTNGSVFLQGKGSSMVAVALDPQPSWEVLDACSAPGNKAVHLAALMCGKGKVIACELHKERVKLLENTVKLAGASNAHVVQGDFLDTGPNYPMIRAILLDPSCSGSGTFADRLDHLLPSHTKDQDTSVDQTRLTKLAAFQKKALEHALSFPSVERVVYSTCSVHQIENEDVVKSVLPLATSNGFRLATPFPKWPRRGLPVFDGSEHLLRMDPKEDKEGFFIALFVREGVESKKSASSAIGRMPFPSSKISRKFLYPNLTSLRWRSMKRAGEV